MLSMDRTAEEISESHVQRKLSSQKWSSLSVGLFKSNFILRFSILLACFAGTIEVDAFRMAFTSNATTNVKPGTPVNLTCSFKLVKDDFNNILFKIGADPLYSYKPESFKGLQHDHFLSTNPNVDSVFWMTMKTSFCNDSSPKREYKCLVQNAVREFTEEKVEVSYQGPVLEVKVNDTVLPPPGYSLSLEHDQIGKDIEIKIVAKELTGALPQMMLSVGNRTLPSNFNSEGNDTLCIYEWELIATYTFPKSGDYEFKYSGHPHDATIKVTVKGTTMPSIPPVVVTTPTPLTDDGKSIKDDDDDLGEADKQPSITGGPKEDGFIKTTAEPEVFGTAGPKEDEFIYNTSEPEVFGTAGPKKDGFINSTSEPELLKTTGPEVGFIETTAEPEVFGTAGPKEDEFINSTSEPELLKASGVGFIKTTAEPEVLGTAGPKEDWFINTTSEPDHLKTTGPEVGFMNTTVEPDLLKTAGPNEVLFYTAAKPEIVSSAKATKEVVIATAATEVLNAPTTSVQSMDDQLSTISGPEILTMAPSDISTKDVIGSKKSTASGSEIPTVSVISTTVKTKTLTDSGHFTSTAAETMKRDDGLIAAIYASSISPSKPLLKTIVNSDQGISTDSGPIRLTIIDSQIIAFPLETSRSSQFEQTTKDDAILTKQRTQTTVRAAPGTSTADSRAEMDSIRFNQTSNETEATVKRCPIFCISQGIVDVGEIVGIVIASILLITIIFGGVTFVMVRRYKRRDIISRSWMNNHYPSDLERYNSEFWKNLKYSNGYSYGGDLK